MLSLPRLYAILDIDALVARGVEPRVVLDVWLDAGIRLVQLRAKAMATGAFLELAEQCSQKCQSAGAMFIVNDRADIARLAGADGVHVGQDDLRPAQIRAVEKRFAIGLSTHTIAQLRLGLAEPADYLAIGPVFPTSSKARPDTVVGVGMVAAASALMDGRPLVAIGGMTRERAAEVLAAGAASVAVISDLLDGDLGSRARAWIAACA